jgi:putative addiction module CopG family antidote
MNVHLTPELEALIQKTVESGRYNSASEVMREALRLMEQRDELLDLRKEEIRRRIIISSMAHKYPYNRTRIADQEAATHASRGFHTT